MLHLSHPIHVPWMFHIICTVLSGFCVAMKRPCGNQTWLLYHCVWIVYQRISMIWSNKMLFSCANLVSFPNPVTFIKIQLLCFLCYIFMLLCAYVGVLEVADISTREIKTIFPPQPTQCNLGDDSRCMYVCMYCTYINYV